MGEEKRVVVIGSGPAGATAALFLGRAGVETEVLEIGGMHASMGITVRWRGSTVFKMRRGLHPRKGVQAVAEPNGVLFEELSPGGLSNHWSCAVPRFSPADFADAARAGAAFAWPIDYDDLAYWYDRVEPLLHIAGTDADAEQLPHGRVQHVRRLSAEWASMVEGAGRSGRSLVPMPYAYGGENTVTFSGTVFNAFVRLLRPAMRAGQVRVHFDARVQRLEWSPGDKRVCAVIFQDARSGAEYRLPCRAVVLAAGAINTPAILLRSTSPDFPEGLGNTHGVLGRYLHDHPLGKLIVDVASPISVHPASYLTRPSLDRSPPLYAAACMQWCNTGYFVKSTLRGRPWRMPWLGFSVFGTQAPEPDGWIALDRARAGEADALTLHLRHPAESQEALVQAKDDVVELLRSSGHDPQVRLWHIEPVGQSVHYGGTCRMHASPRFGMVDGTGRLHAVRNVAVADSSAFTTGPEKNPVLTAMALAARAGSRLASDVKRGEV